MVLGLTGGVATGKSAAAEELMRLGVRVLDADLLAHYLTTYDPTTLFAIRARFGEAVFTRHGALNRSVLADLVFASSGQREDLELILHPQITGILAANIKAARLAREHVVIMAPLLFEGGLNKLCDKVWVISCDEEVQLQRLQKLRGIDEVQGKLRIGTQLPLIQKETLADLVVKNNGTLGELHAQVRNAWEGWVRSHEVEAE